MNSPGFSDFRELMDKWDEASKLFLENDLCLFFKKDGIIYGVTETDRITFARMKNPESEEDLAWKKEASFTAYDLEKTGKEKVARSFGEKEIKGIKVISQEQAEKELNKKGKNIPVVVEDDKDSTYGEE